MGFHIVAIHNMMQNMIHVYEELMDYRHFITMNFNPEYGLIFFRMVENTSGRFYAGRLYEVIIPILNLTEEELQLAIVNHINQALYEFTH